MDRNKFRFVFVNKEAGSTLPPIEAIPKPVPILPSTNVADRPNKTGWRNSDTIALCVAVAIWLVPMPVGHEQVIFLGRMLLVGLALLHPLYQLPWITKSVKPGGRAARTFVVWSAMAATLFIYGWITWPVTKRHQLSPKEIAAFKEQLKQLQLVPKTVELACGTRDDASCIYAEQFVRIFGEAGWDVKNQVLRHDPTSTLVGIRLLEQFGKHSEHREQAQHWEPPQYGWVLLPERMLVAQRAFHAIGIESFYDHPDDAPENQLTIFFATERADEKEPTPLSKTMKDLDYAKETGKIPK